MKVIFTKHDGAVIEEEYAAYSYQSNPANTEHEVFLNPEVDAPEHKYRLRKVGAPVEGTRIGGPLYAKAVFEDGCELGSTDESSVTPDAQEITDAEANADGALSAEEVDHLSHDDLKVELEKRNVEVPTKKSDRVAALKKALDIRVGD